MKIFKKLFFLFLLFPLISFAQYPWSNALGSGGYSPAAFVSWLYNYALYIVGAAAVIMIVWGGIVRLTSAGNPGKMGESNTIIINAILGVVLLFGSYLILKELNPDLLTLKDPNMASVDANSLELQSGLSENRFFYSPSNPCIQCYVNDKEKQVLFVRRSCYTNNEAISLLKNIAVIKQIKNCTTNCVSIHKLGCDTANGIKQLKKHSNLIGEITSPNILVITKGSEDEPRGTLSVLKFEYFGPYTNSSDNLAKKNYVLRFLAGLRIGLNDKDIVSAMVEGVQFSNSNISCTLSIDDILNNIDNNNFIINNCSPKNFVVNFTNQVSTDQYRSGMTDLEDVAHPTITYGCAQHSDKIFCPIDNPFGSNSLEAIGDFRKSCDKIYGTGGSVWPPIANPSVGLLNEKDAKKAIKDQGITYNENYCSEVGQSSCTSYWGLPNSFKQNMKDLSNACKADKNKKCKPANIKITGATEFWLHSYDHGPGKSEVDVIYKTSNDLFEFSTFYPILVELKKTGKLKSFICEKGSKDYTNEPGGCLNHLNDIDHFHLDFDFASTTQCK